jgi:hypothetical protein
MLYDFSHTQPHLTPVVLDDLIEARSQKELELLKLVPTENRRNGIPGIGIPESRRSSRLGFGAGQAAFLKDAGGPMEECRRNGIDAVVHGATEYDP